MNSKAQTLDNKRKSSRREELLASRQRRLEAMHTNYLEGNPFDSDDVALFEMFDREGWDHEDRIAYLRKLPARAGKGPAPDE